jgi:cystathionine beta-lyase family protein involved in aluminum resistance
VKWWKLLGFSSNVVDIIVEAEKNVSQQHHEVDAIKLYNQAKVLKAFQDERITDDCFHSHEGYGYNDFGREKLESLFAKVFQGEDALVRPHFVSGTHTLFTCLKALLRPGERLISVTGLPYDTLWNSILGEDEKGTLLEWGIAFDYCHSEDFLLPEKELVINEMLQHPTKVVFIQRSKGYDPHRSSLTNSQIGFLIQKVRRANSELIVFVDNCYGEFTEKEEPLEAGADLIAGSLIKNPGGGLAPSGGYVVGKEEYVAGVSNALAAPGLGKELGSFLMHKRLFYQGLFEAPHLTGEALKGAITISFALQSLGYDVDPGPFQPRGDIVQSVHLKNKDELETFIAAVQKFSPINSHFTPVAGQTAGYKDPIYMAAGTFVQGSSSEFSADAPLREPYTIYLQGGLNYEHILIGLAAVLEKIL